MPRPALAAPGETKSNVEVFHLLAERPGFTGPCFADTEDETIAAPLDSGHPFLRRIAVEELHRERFVRLRRPKPFPSFARGGFGTPDGKCGRGAPLDYGPPLESRHGAPELRARDPLEPAGSKNGGGMNSTFGYRGAVNAQTSCLHPTAADAAARGISPGDGLRMWNERGTIVLRAMVDGTVPPGGVSAPPVGWGKRSPVHRGVNALTLRA